ncbi:uncharacterized protein [Linepithema humile]|uniref:uncharacterized protein n=1 Tax=Linepithema humile TaxID=83485 RepID=UPI00351EDF2E
MRIVIGLLLILSSEMLPGGSAGEEHVHFKIYVPEVINHQIHTKTVFIHIHKPDISIPKKSKPKAEAPKKNHHTETHYEDWSSWSSYGYNNDHDDVPGNDLSIKNQKDHKDHGVHKEMAHKHNNPFLPYHRDSYMPVSQHNDKPDHLKEQHDYMMEYPRPPQYAVQEDIKETDHNGIEPYVHMYEEGYSKGGESVSGHVYSGDVTKFYEGKHEKGAHSAEEYENDEHEQEARKKTHAGRYFVDDSDYQHDNNKYKANKRVSRRIFVLS